LEIHDVSGQLVRKLSLGQLPAGKYLDQQSSAYWDGRSKVGEQVSSGVYFYTVVTDQQRLTKHMMILK
jgi:flagellar hook assembly protein FlgD